MLKPKSSESSLFSQLWNGSILYGPRSTAYVHQGLEIIISVHLHEPQYAQNAFESQILSTLLAATDGTAVKKRRQQHCRSTWEQAGPLTAAPWRLWDCCQQTERGRATSMYCCENFWTLLTWVLGRIDKKDQDRFFLKQIKKYLKLIIFKVILSTTSFSLPELYTHCVEPSRRIVCGFHREMNAVTCPRSVHISTVQWSWKWA